MPTVTAQDFEKFKDAIIDAEVQYNKKFDEAQSMDDDDMAEKADDKWHNAIRRIYDSVRQEARREALKEMDEAWTECFKSVNPMANGLYKLRKEYQQPN